MDSHRIKDGKYLVNGNPVDLTDEQVVRFTTKKCNKHRVDSAYVLSRILKMRHKSIKELVLNIEEIMYYGFFNEYDSLFAFRRRKRESKNQKKD